MFTVFVIIVKSDRKSKHSLALTVKKCSLEHAMLKNTTRKQSEQIDLWQCGVQSQQGSIKSKNLISLFLLSAFSVLVEAP